MAKKFSDLADACWKGYKAVGLKDKNGKKVPNCVPEEVQMEAKKDEEETVDRVERSDYKISPTGRKSHKQIVFKMGEEDLKEGTVSKKDYSWGKMMTVHHGKDISYPLHPEHQKIVKNLRPSGEHSKAMYKDETGNQVHVTREDDKVHFVSHRTSGSKKTTVDYKHFDESVPAKNTDIADKSYLKDMGKKPTVKSDLKNFKNFLTGKKETNEEVEQVEEGWYQKPASAYRRKGDEVGGGSSKNDVPFDGPYTKTKPAKNSDGTPQSPMSRARTLAKDAMKQKMKEEFGLDITDEQADSLVEASYAPVAPVPDKKYIKGTPENKAYKATKKPINGTPTNVNQEELKGNQHKIDKNKNGKIDANDFKLLRKEEEQLDELDQKTLKSYVNKNLKTGDTSGKRDDGLYRATNKIAKKQATSTLDKKVKTLGNTRPADQKNRYEYEASRSELKNRGIHWFAGRRTTKEEVELDEASQTWHHAKVKKNTVQGTYHSASMDVYGNVSAHKKGFKTSKEAEDHGKSISGKRTSAYHDGGRTRAVYVDESVELDEANHREFASQGKMHPDMAKHMSVGQEMDYYEHGTGDKVSGKVLKNDGKEVHIKQTHDSYDPKKKGTVHKFNISDKLDEKAPPGFEGTVKAMKKHKEIDNPWALAWYMKNKGMKSHKPVKEETEQVDEGIIKGTAEVVKQAVKVPYRAAKRVVGGVLDTVKDIGDAAKNIKKKFKEDFDENGELITNMKSYKEFVQSLDEIKMSDLPSRKVSGKYGTEYYKGEAEKDVKGYDDEDTPAKPAGEKRGRGRPAGSTSGARQKGTIAKRKGSGVEMTGYPVHLPNFK